MGLDMFAYSSSKKNHEGTDRIEIAYWRKHPNLHGWMQRLWESRGNSGDFNGDEVELTEDEINQLDADVIAGKLPYTAGFFFGQNADDYYKEDDLKFVAHARAELFCGRRIFYNSSW